jgi:hypothetical protein
MRPRIAIVSLLLLVLTAGAQDFQIRTRVDLVVVPVTVKGADDKLINGLAQDDFIILEDGQPQTITNFTIDPVPLSAAVIVDTGLSADSLMKVQQTIPALTGAFSEFDEVAVYRFLAANDDSPRTLLDNGTDDQWRPGCSSGTTWRAHHTAATEGQGAERCALRGRIRSRKAGT